MAEAMEVGEKSLAVAVGDPCPLEVGAERAGSEKGQVREDRLPPPLPRQPGTQEPSQVRPDDLNISPPPLAVGGCDRHGSGVGVEVEGLGLETADFISAEAGAKSQTIPSSGPPTTARNLASTSTGGMEVSISSTS